MPKYTYKIQESWFLIEKYKGWLCKVDGNDTMLFYSACQTSFDIQNIRNDNLGVKAMKQKKFSVLGKANEMRDEVKEMKKEKDEIEKMISKKKGPLEDL